MRHDEAIERYRVPVDEYLRRSEANLDEYDEIKQSLASGRGFEVEPTYELASEVIHSMETDTPREVYGNVHNGSLIENLPPECCIEVPCNIDGAGIRPLAAGRLPVQLAALNRTFLNVAELTVRAALEGDREHVYQAAMMDPNTAATLRLDQIHDLCDELIDAHREFLSMF
jgi:alpha-galactosidase